MNNTDNNPESKLENEQNNSSFHTEPIQDSDELFIELDESYNDEKLENQENASAETSGETSEQTNSESNIIAEKPTETPIAQKPVSKKTKQKPSKKKAAVKKTPVEKGEKSSKKSVFLVVLLFVLIGITCFYMYTKQPALLMSWFPFLEKKEYVSTEEIQTLKEQENASESVIFNESESENELESEFENEIESEVTYDYEAEDEYITEEQIIEEITEVLTTQHKTVPTTVSHNVSQFKTPVWLISYASVSKNTNAITAVKKLREMGNSAGYYWMPDYAENAPQMYKVYIGPFDTKSQAEAHISSIQELEPHAYVLYVAGK
ncbi:MAG: SPOR domain-containing protein [Bacteroidales bacterium]|nr:SPOR domain-containing protein [Bacteroidales bacterium]NLK81319.1 SPOR domain-containing protein [Bacteroidales bacterium]HPY82062.1 SPOR domain-containing protein [Bacteroidales bacterium]